LAEEDAAGNDERTTCTPPGGGEHSQETRPGKPQYRPSSRIVDDSKVLASNNEAVLVVGSSILLDEVEEFSARSSSVDHRSSSNSGRRLLDVVTRVSRGARPMQLRSLTSGENGKREAESKSGLFFTLECLREDARILEKGARVVGAFFLEGKHTSKYLDNR